VGFYVLTDPQLTSSLPPTLYRFIPQTFSGKRVCKLMNGVENGDYDPMDICVLCERPIARAEVLITANVVGGIPMIDGGLADDKIIAILQGDPVLGHIKEMEDVPENLLNRLFHYFSTYKKIPNYKHSVEVGEPYGRTHAEEVILASIEDYKEQFKI
jgi:inorganic pyrophosphatase